MTRTRMVVVRADHRVRLRLLGYARADAAADPPRPPDRGRLDRLAGARDMPGLGPDGSVQVTVEYEDDRPARIDALVIQVLHRGEPADLRDAIRLRVLAADVRAHCDWTGCLDAL